MKKILGVLSAVVLALTLASCSKAESNSVKIGGIFPLSGQVAVYGVECKNGVDLAIEEKDHATNNFLQWFVEEQVEEEENAMELVAKIKLADGDNRLIYELNKELGARAPSQD